MPQRTSWKTSSNRRTRPSASGPRRTPGSIGGLNSSFSSQNKNNPRKSPAAAAAVSGYKKQLNAFRSSSGHDEYNNNNNNHTNGHLKGSIQRRPSQLDDEYDDLLLDGKQDLDLGDSDGDELGLDDILGSIDDDNKNGDASDGNKVMNPTVMPSVGPVVAGQPWSRKDSNGSSNNKSNHSNGSMGLNQAEQKHDDDDILAALEDDDQQEAIEHALFGNNKDEQLSPMSKRLQISAVDFSGKGDTISIVDSTSSPPLANNNVEQPISSKPTSPEMSPVSDTGIEEDNDTMWTDGDATRQHKLLSSPAMFQHVGFEDSGTSKKLDDFPTVPFGPRSSAVGNRVGGGKNNGTGTGNSLVDSLIDDISMPGVGDSVLSSITGSHKRDSILSSITGSHKINQGDNQPNSSDSTPVQDMLTDVVNETAGNDTSDDASLLDLIDDATPENDEEEVVLSNNESNKPAAAATIDITPPRGAGRYSSRLMGNTSGPEVKDTKQHQQQQQPADPEDYPNKEPLDPPLLDEVVKHDATPQSQSTTIHSSSSSLQQQQANNKFHTTLPSTAQTAMNTSSSKLTATSNNTSNRGSKIGRTIQLEDETLSTVTDPTESPFIYTYKKQQAENMGAAHDDDSVSQITSSLAGTVNSSFGSSGLQNIPSGGINVGGRSNRLSWMNNGGSGFGTGNRMLSHRNNKNGGGLAISGPYGRDRGGKGRSNNNNKSSGMNNGSWANTGSINARTNSRGSNSNSGSGDGSVNSFEKSFDGIGVKGGGDEIDYAMNAESKKSRGANSRSSGGSGVRPSAPIGLPYPNTINEDLSLVDEATFMTNEQYTQSTDGQYIDTNMKSSVSRLGMGGVSTIQPQHSSALPKRSSGSSVISEGDLSTMSASSVGVFTSLAEWTFKTQHYATRFFFPPSKKERNRKKFDREDSSMDDLESLLIEEGAKPRNNKSGGGGLFEEEDEEIDYFSRAMSSNAMSSNVSSISNGSAMGKDHPAQRASKRKKKGSLFRIAFLLTSTITLYRASTLYRMNGKQDNNGEPPEDIEYQHVDEAPNHRDFRMGTDLQPDEDLIRQQHEHEERMKLQEQQQQQLQEEKMIDVGDGQVLEYATGAIVDRKDVRAGRLGQPIEAGEELNDPSSQKQHFLVNGVTQLPAKFESLASVDDLLFQRGIDVPFFWHVPRSAGGTMNDVLGSCLHLTLAADAGASDGHGQDDALKVLHFGKSVSYVNVDTSTLPGLTRAKNLNLVSSGLADVVISPLLHDASTLFTPTRRGRMFTIFRHPVERAASLFYFIQETQWKQPGTRNDQFADISIEAFYRGGFAENNWMTRFLTNELTKGELTDDDLRLAKEVLRQKCMVGLLEEKTETFERIQKFFGWRPKSGEERSCLEKKLDWAWPMKHKHPDIEPGSRADRLIIFENKYDIQLYEYAKELFVQQGKDLFPQ